MLVERSRAPAAAEDTLKSIGTYVVIDLLCQTVLSMMKKATHLIACTL